MSSSLLRSAIVLGSLALVSPFAIDMYLPAMPAIAADLGVSETAAQATITSYFIAFGLAAVAGVLINLVIIRHYDASALGVFNLVYAAYILLSQLASKSRVRPATR